MKKLTIIILLCLGSGFADVLSLQDCYEKANANHPLQQERVQRQQIYNLNTKNLNSTYLPAISVNAKAVYNSDVVEFGNMLSDLPLPLAGDFSLGEMPKDQYKATLDVKQILYDGGMIRYSKQLEKAALAAEQSQLDVELYKIYDRINQVYFSLLLLEEHKQLTLIFRDQVEEQKSALQTSVENGVVLAGNLDVLQAELLKIEQQLSEIDINTKQLQNMLATLIGESVQDAELRVPESGKMTATHNRPELALFSAQRERLTAAQKLTSRKLWPKLSAFGSFGYGNPPGNDFFTNEFDTYYMVGAGLSWTPFDWQTNKRQRQTLTAQRHILTVREQDFSRSINLLLASAQAEIDKMQSMLQTDDKLVKLRQKISQSAASQLENGTITSTEYLTELNQERQARINLQVHTIQLAQAKINYKTISGQFYKEN